MPGDGPVRSEQGVRFSCGFPKKSAQKSMPSRSVCWTETRTSPILEGMETCAAFRPRVRRESLVTARLCVATMRLTDVEPERIWAIDPTDGRRDGAELSSHLSGCLPCVGAADMNMATTLG